MLELTLAAVLMTTTPQASQVQATLTQAEYNAFRRCHGQVFGFYRTGIILFGGTQIEADVHEGAGGMNEFLSEVDQLLMQTGVQLDWQAGYAVYQRAHEEWSNFHNRRDAEDAWFDANPIPGCNAAIERVAGFIDSVR